MSWIRVLTQADLPDGTRRVVRAGGRSILLLNKRGKIYAMQSTCPHMAFPLQFAKVTEDESIVCALHHSAFDLSTGDVKAWSPWPPLVGPMFKKVSREKALQLYPIRVDQGSIWVELKTV